MATRSRTAGIPGIPEASTAGAWELAENTAMRLPRGSFATMVRVERGTVLVTQEGDLKDHVLEAGDEFVLRPSGLAVAWAFTDAAVSVRRAALAGRKARPPARVRGALSPGRAREAASWRRKGRSADRCGPPVDLHRPGTPTESTSCAPP